MMGSKMRSKFRGVTAQTASGPQHQHNAMAMVRKKAIALSLTDSTTTPISLLAARTGSDEKILPKPKAIPIETNAPEPIAVASNVFDPCFFRSERALA